MDKEDVTIDYTNALAEASGPGGVPLSELKGLAGRAEEIHRDLVRGRESGELAFFDLPYQNMTRLMKITGKKRADVDNVVVLGIGGSALGARALAGALLPPLHQIACREERNDFPRLFVADNIDPDYFAGLLRRLSLGRTLFIVISKSGGTAETMAQFLIVRDLLISKLGRAGYAERMLAVTDAESGYLRQIADRDGLEWLPAPRGVGGRFSVLSAVGLLPASLCGVDVLGLLRGAAAMDKRTRTPLLFENPAYLLGALYYLADTMLKRNVLVMMPYASGLLDLAEWFGQLWAESLGKAFHTDGSAAGTGSTPVRALGATDQHSQVQLYIEGPQDKLITFIKVRRFSEKGRISPQFEDMEGVGYLGGHSLAELISAEQRATERALLKAGRPSVRIEMPALDACAMGQLMYLLETATVFAGGLYRVNPLDQPGVELGKRYAFGMMGRKGFEDEGREMGRGDEKARRTV